MTDDEALKFKLLQQQVYHYEFIVNQLRKAKQDNDYDLIDSVIDVEYEAIHGPAD